LKFIAVTFCGRVATLFDLRYNEVVYVISLNKILGGFFDHRDLAFSLRLALPAKWLDLAVVFYHSYHSYISVLLYRRVKLIAYPVSVI